MTLRDDGICIKYFGKTVYGGFLTTVEDVVYNMTSSYKKPIYVSNSIHLANFDTLAQLVIEKKKKEKSSLMYASDYVELFKSNIDKFVNPEANDNNTTTDDLLYQKYFGCNLTKWETNIEELLDRPFNQTITGFSKNENAIYNYEILKSYISNSSYLLLTTSCVKKHFTENEKKFKELSPTPNSTTHSTVTTTTINNFNPKANSTGTTTYSNGSSSSTSTAPPIIVDSNTELKSTTNTNSELTEKKLMEKIAQLTNSNNQHQQTIKTQQEKISNLEQKVKDLQKHADIKEKDNNLLLKDNNLLKEKNSKLELQLSNNNTILSFNSIHLIQQKYLEQARNALLKYFTNELMDILLNLPSTIDDSTGQLLELLMKRSICHAFATSLDVVFSATQHLVLLMTQNGLLNSDGGLTSIVGILLEKFHKIVKELFECIQSIPKEMIQFDFSNDLKDKTIEKSGKNSKEETTTNYYYCILPSLYSGGHVLCEEQGVVILQ